MIRVSARLTGNILLTAAVVFGASIAGTVPVAEAAASSVPAGAINTRPLPTDTSTFTVSDWAKYGVHPDMSGPNTYYQAQIVAVKPSSGSVVPDTHNGCNQNVCIFVEGNGLEVSSWGTSAYFPQANQCSYPVFLNNNSVVYTGPEYCGGPGNTGIYNRPGFPYMYPSPVNLCNEWPGINGEPCAYVS